MSQVNKIIIIEKVMLNKKEQWLEAGVLLQDVNVLLPGPLKIRNNTQFAHLVCCLRSKHQIEKRKVYKRIDPTTTTKITFYRLL